MKVIYFGILSEVTGSREEDIPGIGTLSGLKDQIYNRFSHLGEHPHIVAVNQQIVHGDLSLNENDEIAFLPPYSGG